MTFLNHCRFLVGTATIITALQFAAPLAQAQDDSVAITVVGAFAANEWHSELKAGAEQAVADLDFPVELRVVGPTDFDPVQQAQIFSREALTNPDALIVSNVAAALFVQPALDAKNQGIKVVWSNSAPTAEFADDLFVSADPSDQGIVAAKVIADILAKKMGKPANEIEGSFVVGLCVPGLAVLENRIAGLRAGLGQVMPKVEVSSTIETKPDRSGSFVAWNQAIQANRDALGFADACEAGQQNIAKIIEDDGMEAVTVAFDAPEEIRNTVKRGFVQAALPSNFYLQGYLSVLVTATALHEGKDLPSGWAVVPTTVFDSSNIDEVITAWENPSTGLRKYFDGDVQTVLKNIEDGKLEETAEYDTPPQ